MFSSLVSRMIDQLILGEFGLGKENYQKVKIKKESKKKQQNHVVCKWIYYERSKPVCKTLYCSLENNLHYKKNNKIIKVLAAWNNHKY